jgi:hypothetical protein
MVFVHGPVLVRGRGTASLGSEPDVRPRGAYGLTVTGLEAEAHLLVDAEPSWPAVEIVLEPGPSGPGELLLEEDVASYPDAYSGHVVVDRRTGVASFRGAGGLTTDEIVHPRLGMLAAVYAQWLPGRTAFHAGAFVAGGRAWAVVGQQGAGKSTMMAALALSGVAVLGDDTLVLDAGRCIPDVRCIDLRPDAAERLAIRDPLASVRRGARERVLLDEPIRDAPLAGWLFLTWGDELALRELPTPERVARVGHAQGWHRRGVTDPASLLELSALPAWELTRPRDWPQLPRAVEHVRELAAR